MSHKGESQRIRRIAHAGHARRGAISRWYLHPLRPRTLLPGAQPTHDIQEALHAPLWIVKSCAVEVIAERNA